MVPFSFKILIVLLITPIFIFIDLSNLSAISMNAYPPLKKGQYVVPLNLIIVLLLIIINWKKIIYRNLDLVLIILLTLAIDMAFSNLTNRELIIRISLIYFIYSYELYKLILKNISSDFLVDIKKFICYLTISIIAIWFFTAQICGPGYLISCDIYSYNFQQYSAAIITCLFLYSIHVFKLAIRLMMFLIYLFSIIWCFNNSDSRLIYINVIGFILIYISLSIKEIKIIYRNNKILFLIVIFGNLIIILYSIYIDNNIMYDLQTWRSGLWVNFFKSLSIISIFFPYLNTDIDSIYSYHNEFIEIFRVLGLPFFILFYTWVIKLIDPSKAKIKNCWILLWMILGYGLVINPLSHFYSGAIISFLLAINIINNSSRKSKNEN
jgi:hypothetical protein